MPCVVGKLGNAVNALLNPGGRVRYGFCLMVFERDQYPTPIDFAANVKEIPLAGALRELAAEIEGKRVTTRVEQ